VTTCIQSDTTPHKRLASRRPSGNFDVECDGLRDVTTVSHLTDGRLAEIAIFNHSPYRGADVGARDAALATSIALQHGVHVKVIRRALRRGSQAQASCLFGAALDITGGGKR
jgi:hypothetical protein